ncbi:MAG: class I SAM-dependent methyltransferase [Candidatus Marinimicrobia bacterium]|nr:class I SAM-dependent methyltransferase [Candidatus Neomarinimicrobiota bacterium]MBT3839027.1 class I SAM-dependent methyltransferase [Candidatus Neomarinimicrobiota bacterium]MBT5461764.1 class I SAM-dependent methyltransferase [Candidatus Neomarinimicrobiota bacterium]MBT5759940.1 class I SAM-dependent methyltransferase [Candidatus Neomarinimicrobiota bacterium]MBT6863013.1 class I SAM-dependent methyltransferase [Candidatus Neomarinimicrobiota bacterium]
MDISIPTQMADPITDRCLRCYREQQWYGENFLFDFIGDTDVSDKRVLEIGCAEAGLLKFYQKKGAICSGMELSDIRFKNALLLNKSDSLHLFQANICQQDSYVNEIPDKYDMIVLRDVIEHIGDKKTALTNIFNLLKPDGKLFMSFPPKYCAYAGHQQTIPKFIGKLPYLHLLPNFLYKMYMGLIGVADRKINYLISTKETRISIRQMRKLVYSIGFNVKTESHWFLRPAYSFRFGLPKMRNPFSLIFGLDEIFSNGVIYLLERPKL